MKNSLITIIIIISTLTFYSCSDEDDIKTEPEKSIEDCLEFIYVVEDEYTLEYLLLQRDEYKNIKVDTCNFEYPHGGDNFVAGQSIIFYYIDAVYFSVTLQNNKSFFKEDKSNLQTSDISDEYKGIREIIQQHEENSTYNFTFNKVRNTGYTVNINRYISSFELDKINDLLEQNNYKYNFFLYETPIDVLAEMEEIK